MAEGTAEPSIEEILASIRKIISDDDAEPETQGAAAPEEEVLELTDIVEDEPVEEEHHEHDHHPEPAHESEFQPEPTPVTVMPEATIMNNNETPATPMHSSEDSGIITDHTLAATTGAFAKLSHEAEPPEPRTSGDGRTVEDITRELLRPMLRQWMDQNLPQIVERLVERELRKISRKAEDL